VAGKTVYEDALNSDLIVPGLDVVFTRMQVSGSYAEFWRGVGFFALGAVGPSWPDPSVWSKKDFAHYLRLRTSRWVGK
jgi:hypothetical protein